MALRSLRPTRPARGALRVNAILSQTQYKDELIATAVGFAWRRGRFGRQLCPGDVHCT